MSAFLALVLHGQSAGVAVGMCLTMGNNEISGLLAAQASGSVSSFCAYVLVCALVGMTVAIGVAASLNLHDVGSDGERSSKLHGNAGNE